jgi:hypothetical protein
MHILNLLDVAQHAGNRGTVIAFGVRHWSAEGPAHEDAKPDRACIAAQGKNIPLSYHVTSSLPIGGDLPAIAWCDSGNP